MKLGGKVSQFDNALFLWHNEDGSIIGILALHVDDFVYCGTSNWHHTVIQKLLSAFRISKKEQGCFRYIGLNVVQTRNSIYIDQNNYIDELKTIEIESERALQKDELLNQMEKTALRRLSGQLLWITANTRPDAAFDSCCVSNYGKEPTVKNILAANKAVKKVKNTAIRIVFPDLGNPEHWKILVYGDATHASLPSGASQGAYLVFIDGGKGIAPIAWRSKKLDRVTKSPLASETMALAEAADAGHFVAAMIQEIFGLKQKCKVVCFTDNKSLKDHLETSNIVSDLRLRVDMARLKEMVQMEEITINWVEGKRQLADSLTKYNASAALLAKVLKYGIYQ